MMTRPRSTLVSPADTRYYHCIGRCVRRSFLCGKDPLTGRNFEHRKGIILKRLALLTETFSIDICAYALMSNHYHLVVRLAPERATSWSSHEVVERWRRLYSGPSFLERFLAGAQLTDLEQSCLDERLPVWRQRLNDLSWFMRCLNEYIARVANAEDECTGRFWEGRFKSQALLDEQALLTVMAYVDLNPVRAGLADSIATSAFTSGKQRLNEVTSSDAEDPQTGLPRLAPFTQSMRGELGHGLPYSLLDYLDLLDTSGRHVHPDRRNQIPAGTPRLLVALGIEHSEWMKTVLELHARFRLFIGTPARLRSLAQARGWRWVRGHAAARRLYGCAKE